jgi:translation initiation factor IF-1
MAQRNTRGGSAYKKSKSGNVRRRSKNPDMPVDISTGFDHYAIVLKRLGNNRLSAKLDNGLEVQAVIPGRFMKKVWFNPGDYIHVKREGEDGKFYYDIFQKIVNEGELQNAKIAIQKKLDDGEQDIFRPDTKIEEEDEEDFDEIPDNSEDVDSSDADDVLEQMFGSNKNINKKKTDSEPGTKSSDTKTKITADKIQRKNVTVDKLIRKQQQKDRDIARRTEPEFIEKPTSLVQPGDKSESGSGSEDVNIDDI